MIRKFFSTLNARLVAIHFVAIILFVYAVLILSLLHDFKFLQPSSIRINVLNNPPRFNKDMKFIELFGNIGLLVAYVNSWAVSNKKGWYWLNGVIAFLLVFILKVTGLFGWEHVQDALQAPKKATIINTMGGYITIGGLLLAISLFLFYGKKILAYIEKGNPVVKKPTGKKSRK